MTDIAKYAHLNINELSLQWLKLAYEKFRKEIPLAYQAKKEHVLIYIPMELHEYISQGHWNESGYGLTCSAVHGGIESFRGHPVFPGYENAIVISHVLALREGTGALTVRFPLDALLTFRTLTGADLANPQTSPS